MWKKSKSREGGVGWGQGRDGGHYPQQENIELAQTNSHNDPWWGNNGAGSQGPDPSSASDKQPVWTNLGLGQTQTLALGQFGMPPPCSIAFSRRFLKRCGLLSTHLSLPHLTSSLVSIVSMCVSTNCANQMFLYRMSYSAVLFNIRSSSVCQDVGSANSMVICMFPWYILDWLSNLKPLTRTGKSCNGTCRTKSICFIVKIECTETLCINCRPTLWLIHSLSHTH